MLSCEKGGTGYVKKQSGVGDIALHNSILSIDVNLNIVDIVPDAQPLRDDLFMEKTRAFSGRTGGSLSFW